MIKNIVDHSANERTFLAGVRTAIAVMAFGFIVEKFDLFLRLAAPSVAGARCRCPARNPATQPDWHSSFLGLPWLPLQQLAF
jgi:putative membrane protein